ncbi:MAG: hypothetical protein ACI8UO_001521 [Verrucomicrobiales bacterium]
MRFGRVRAAFLIAAFTTVLSGVAAAFDPAPPAGQGVIAIHVQTGEVLWQAWSIDEAPAEFRQWLEVSRFGGVILQSTSEKTARAPEPHPDELGIEKHYDQSLKKFFLHLVDHKGEVLASHEDLNPSSNSLSEFGWIHVTPEGGFLFFDRKEPAEGKPWGKPVFPTWNLPKMRQTIATKLDTDRFWIANADRLMGWNRSLSQQLLDVKLEGIRDYGPANGYTGLAGLEIRLRDGLVLVSTSRELTAVDTETGEQRWLIVHNSTTDGVSFMGLDQHPEILLIGIEPSLPECIVEMIETGWIDGSLGFDPPGKPEDHRIRKASLSGVSASGSEFVAAGAELARAFGEGCYRRILRAKLESGQLPNAAKPIVGRIVESDWPNETSFERLERFCVNQLVSTDSANPLPRELVWAVLQERFVGRAYSAMRPTWRGPSRFLDEGPIFIPRSTPSAEILELCRQTLTDGAEKELAPAASILLEHASKRNNSEVISELIKHSAPQIWTWAAGYRVARGERKEMAGELLATPLSDRLIAIEFIQKALVNPDPDEIPTYDEKELPVMTSLEARIVKEALEEFGLTAAGDFYHGFMRHADYLAGYPKILELARSLLSREAAEFRLNIESESGLRYLMKIVAAADDPADTPILQSLLGHPFPSVGPKFCFFPIRSEAKELLEARGVSVPADLETKMPLVDADAEREAEQLQRRKRRSDELILELRTKFGGK